MTCTRRNMGKNAAGQTLVYTECDEHDFTECPRVVGPTPRYRNRSQRMRPPGLKKVRGAAKKRHARYMGHPDELVRRHHRAVAADPRPIPDFSGAPA